MSEALQTHAHCMSMSAGTVPYLPHSIVHSTWNIRLIILYLYAGAAVAVSSMLHTPKAHYKQTKSENCKSEDVLLQISKSHQIALFFLLY